MPTTVEQEAAAVVGIEVVAVAMITDIRPLWRTTKCIILVVALGMVAGREAVDEDLIVREEEVATVAVEDGRRWTMCIDTMESIQSMDRRTRNTSKRMDRPMYQMEAATNTLPR